jgi:chemotaxis protein methyltransferase CheR
MQHRIANSLQIIASILMLKARAVKSDETRGHLQDAHTRVMSVASVQKYLQPTGRGEPIEIVPYLTTLCASLARSMIGDSRPVELRVEGTRGTMLSAEAVSIGLIVMESVINALKHGFPDDRQDGQIIVKYAVTDIGWVLSITDNGVGTSALAPAGATAGLGTTIIKALSQQLNAGVEVVSTQDGTSIFVRHGGDSLTLSPAA